MSLPVVIFGAGKVADVVHRHLAKSDYEIAAFTCDGAFVPADGHYANLPVVAFEGIEERFPPERYAMIVAVGYHNLNAFRRQRYNEAKAKGYRLVSYVSARASVGDWLELGDNCVILDRVVVEPGVRLGNNVVLWSGALVGHHSVIEDHCWVAGHATFGGSSRLGASSFVGLGAIVGHEVEIGPQSFLGAGTLVTKCAEPKSVFLAKSTERYRLDSDAFLRISKMR